MVCMGRMLIVKIHLSTTGLPRRLNGVKFSVNLEKPQIFDE